VPVAATNDERVRATPETPRVRALTPDETRAWADIATDDEHYCEHVKDFRRAWIGAVAVAYGEHLAAAAGPIDEREAAYRASVDELTTAWKENPEFGNAIHVATVLGRTEPLKEYLASDKPLSLANRLGLIAIIERLEQSIASLEHKKVGRPQRKSDAWNAATAERHAALLVASDQAAWRKENGRERVPPAQTEEMINRAIAEAAKAFGVPAASIKKDNIRIALKAGRI
jgi:predicted nucleic acid-binding protein